MIKRYVQRAKRTISLFLENDVVVYAGHATLGIITAFFPLVMLIISLLNMIPWYSPEDFTNLVFRFLPDIPQMKNLFLGVVTNLRSQSNGLLASIAGATSLWSASGGVTAIQKGLIRISQNQRKGLKNKGISLLFTLFIVILIPAVLVFNFLGGALTDLVTALAARLVVGPAGEIDDEVRDEVDEDALHRVFDVVRDLEFHRCRVLCEQSDEPEGQEETDDDDADGDSHSFQAFLEVLGGLSVQFFVHDRMTFPLEIQ